MKTARKAPKALRKSSRGTLQRNASAAKARPAARGQTASQPTDTDVPNWTYLTNHTHVLVLLSRNPTVVLREVALYVGITERAVQRIIADLESSGVIEREKVGRQNRYRILMDQPLRHPNEAHRTIGELLALINGSTRAHR